MKGGIHELALFAGSGGGILGGMLHGWRTVCAVEIEDYPRRVLLQRQADEILPRFPVWDDVRTFDGKPWKGKIDVISGGFPCQDISAAGKGAGIEGSRSGLWKEMFRIIKEVQPRHVFVENSEMLIWRGLNSVIDDLEGQGFGGAATVFPALFVAGTHVRNRIFILADSTRIGWKWVGCTWEGTKEMESNRLGGNCLGRGPMTPELSELAMGFPIGWTDLRPLGMLNFRRWLQEHGRCSNESN